VGLEYFGSEHNYLVQVIYIQLFRPKRSRLIKKLSPQFFAERLAEEAPKKNAKKIIPAAMDMDATGKELEPNRAILDLGIQDEEQRDKQWAVQGYMRGLQKPGSMSDTQGACGEVRDKLLRH
jgi:hypothetical protein